MPGHWASRPFSVVQETTCQATDASIACQLIEGDLIAGSGNSFIATLVERHTRYVMLAKVGNKDSHSVVQALIKQAHKLPKELYRSLTWGRGSEMAGHKKFTLATDIDVYFCDPRAPLSSLQTATAGQCLAARY